MNGSQYPEKIFLERCSEKDFPDEDTYWDEVPRNETDMPYVRYDLVQDMRKTVADLYQERDIAMSRIATLQSELEMAKEVLKPFTKADSTDFKATQRARRARHAYRILGAR